MKRVKAPPVVDFDRKTVEQMLERAQAALVASDFDLVKGMVDTIMYLMALVRAGRTSLARLRRLFGLSGSEKRADVVGAGEQATPTPDAGAGDETPPAGEEKSAETVAGSGVANAGSKPAGTAEGGQKKKGHGRVPASAYVAATHIAVPHESYRVGDPCPCGCKGKLYRLPEPALFLRIFGQAPLKATCWDCEQLRSSGCGKVYKAHAPQEAQEKKYDETAGSMIALLCYGAGTPFYRLAHLQEALGTPVPASTLWDVIAGRADIFRPVYDKLKWISAQGSLFYNDDSYMRVLQFMGKHRAALLAKDELAKASAKDEPVKVELPDPERTGLFTTAIVSIAEARPPIVLFFTGRKHAGENLALLLSQRDANLPPPMLMSDALSRNLPAGHEVVWSNCLAHGRRKIVDEHDNYPVECAFIFDKLAHAYAVDARCREEGLSAEERLKVHQRDSTSAMAEMYEHMTKLLADKCVEPNSGIGEAFNYFLKRWSNFTRFLHVPGAPLDNNICERALKMAIKHRNGSLCYRSARGAEVGDMYMTLIYTTELTGENSFEYLTALQRHAKDVAENPAAWLPWNYRDTLVQRGETVAARPVSRLAKPRPATKPRAPPAEDVTLPKAA